MKRGGLISIFTQEIYSGDGANGSSAASIRTPAGGSVGKEVRKAPMARMTGSSFMVQESTKWRGIYVDYTRHASRQLVVGFPLPTTSHQPGSWTPFSDSSRGSSALVLAFNGFRVCQQDLTHDVYFDSFLECGWS
jgi:hypothetical protein